MSGHGELAVIRDHQLFLVGGPVSGTRRVPLGQQAGDPEWSADGKWLSVVVTAPAPKSNPYADEPSKILILTAEGRVVHNLSRGTDEYDVMTAWSPSADRLAISYTLHAKSPNNDRDVLAVADPVGGSLDGKVAARIISGFAWSPDGSRIAASINGFAGEPGAWHSRLVTISATSDARHRVTTAEGNVFEVAGWWPDGSGILTWLDYQGSASLAADGLPLYDVSVTSGHRRLLAKSMLQYPQWLATSPTTDEVAFVAGGSRELTGGHKHLVVCGLSSCHRLAQGASRVSFDPAWSDSGQLAFVRDRATNDSDGYAMSYVDRVQASGGVQVRSVSGLRHAVRPARGAAAPMWGTDGAMLVVRRDALWLLAPGLRHATKVVSGVQVPSDYYGFVPWRDSFAWTEAVRG